jgi:hypothetical protein
MQDLVPAAALYIGLAAIVIGALFYRDDIRRALREPWGHDKYGGTGGAAGGGWGGGGDCGGGGGGDGGAGCS